MLDFPESLLPDELVEAFPPRLFPRRPAIAMERAMRRCFGAFLGETKRVGCTATFRKSGAHMPSRAFFARCSAATKSSRAENSCVVDVVANPCSSIARLSQTPSEARRTWARR
jgi:hypothetical protein